jgi:glycosyltransferase involved in cell wall biosynthesis
MKIAIVANTSWYVFNFRKNLIKLLQARKHEVCVIAPRDDYTDALTQLSVKYYPIDLSQRGVNPFRELISCVRLFRLFRAIRPDIVLTFTIKCNLYTGICSRFVKFQQIANISGLGEAFDKKGLVYYIVSFLYKFALTKSKRVFFQNYEDQQTMIRRGLLPQQLCKHIPGSGVDLGTYCPAPSFLQNNPRRFLMFGRLVPKKGYNLFMKVAEQVQLKNKNRAEFWIMGIPDKSRKESKQLLQRIMLLQERGVVKYIAPRDDTVPVLQMVDVVVLPSQYNEGVPRTLLEAMACGKPVITTDWKGCRDTVDHGVNGYLVNVDDCQSLERYIIDLIRAPYEQLEKMGIASRKKAEKQFDQRKVLKTYLNEVDNQDVSKRKTKYDSLPLISDSR